MGIPYKGKELYGILSKPAGIAKPPVLVMVGLDSAKEETDVDLSLSVGAEPSPFGVLTVVVGLSAQSLTRRRLFLTRSGHYHFNRRGP